MVSMFQMQHSTAGDRTSPVPRRSRPRVCRMGTSVIAAASVALLFLSFFGPLLDHHFTEKLPHHDHLYLGITDAAHDHPFETEHTHGLSVDQAGHHEHDGGTGDTLYLVSGEESGTNSHHIDLTATSHSSQYPPFDPISAPRLGGERDPESNIISPPVRPPSI